MQHSNIYSTQLGLARICNIDTTQLGFADFGLIFPRTALAVIKLVINISYYGHYYLCNLSSSSITFSLFSVKAPSPLF